MTGRSLSGRVMGLMLSLIISLGLPAAAFAAQDSAALKAEIATRWHVTVADQDLSARIVPLVAKPDRPVTMQDLSSPNAPACLQTVIAAFAAYPQPFISDLVQQVALADMIHAWSIRIGGFHAPGLIALNCEDAAGYGTFNLETMHEEIAALLLLKVPLDGAAWQNLNPSGFRYGDTASYKAELRDPHDRAGDEALHQNGFVSQIGLTGLGNDFGSYAVGIFGRPQAFAALLKQYPAMRGKARMVMALYAQAAPALKDSFAAAGLMEAAQ